MARAFIMALAVVAANALQVHDPKNLPPGWRLIIPGSRPGSAHPPQLPAGAKWPYRTHNEKREEWGDRLLAAVKATAGKDSCGGFVSFGDFTWCAKVMPKESKAARSREEPWGPVLAVTESHRASMMQEQSSGDQFLAITMGIRERDMWSELMSNRYHVPSKLYDCFFSETRGPMYDSKLTAAAKGKKECPTWRDGVCYGAEYEAKKVCVGTKDENSQFTKDKAFEPLSTVLKDRSPLSTYVKMDVEGSEWDVLEELLNSEKDMNKIRTLDMEVHFLGFKSAKNTPQFEKAMERNVRLMERLAEKFAVVASTVQATHEALEQRVRLNWPINPLEPLIYTTNGFSLEKFTIDLVNRNLL